MVYENQNQINSTMNEMRRLINLVESAQHEQLDEGPVGKALATAALSLGLQFGQQVNADEVYVYQDKQGELQTAQSIMQVPDDSPLSYVIDTDTQKIKYLKQPDPNQVKQPDSKSQGKQLVGQLVSGMTMEQVKALYPDVRDGGDGPDGKRAVTTTGMGNHNTVKYYLKYSLFGNKGGRTFFEFNENNQLVGVYVYQVLVKEFKPVKKGMGLFGFDKNEIPMLMQRAAKIIPPEYLGSITGKVQVHKGGEFGMNLGVSKLAKIGGDVGGVGLGFGMDKVGNAWSTVMTSKGQFSMQHITQSGMVNSFKPTAIVVGVKDKNMLSKADTEFSY